MEKAKLVKQNKKSVIYEIGEYQIKLEEPKRNKTIKINELGKYWYDGDKDFDGDFYAESRNMVVTNKLTGKTSRKRVYQNDPIGDFERDLTKKIQFRDLFKKIDKQ